MAEGKKNQNNFLTAGEFANGIKEALETAVSEVMPDASEEEKNKAALEVLNAFAESMFYSGGPNG